MLPANADDVDGALPDDEDGLTNPAADLMVTIESAANSESSSVEYDRLSGDALWLDRLQRGRLIRQCHGACIRGGAQR